MMKMLEIKNGVGVFNKNSQVVGKVLLIENPTKPFEVMYSSTNDKLFITVFLSGGQCKHYDFNGLGLQGKTIMFANLKKELMSE